MTRNIIYTKTTQILFKEHFPGQSGVASCTLDFQSLIILIPSLFTRQVKALCAHMVLWAMPHSIPLTAIPKGFWSISFYMPDAHP